MAIKDTLNKIVERHPDVIGGMVLANGRVVHNLDEPYDIISVDLVLETLTEIFENTAVLADEGCDFSEVMMDFANHSLIVRTIEGGVLAVLSPRLQRGQLVKLHVGLGIFAKAVQKAVEEEAAEPIAEEPAAPAPADAIEEPVEAASMEASVEEPEGEAAPVRGFVPRKRGMFRGTAEMLSKRPQSAPLATSEPVFKEDQADVNDGGVPLNPDGTPKKKKMYRGQVYYE